MSQRAPKWIALAVLAGFAAFAQAQGGNPAATPGIDATQARQQARIQQGVATGELTPKEAARLQAQQNHIAARKAAAKADGVVTPKERRELRAAQNDASRRIHRQKHDRQQARPLS